MQILYAKDVDQRSTTFEKTLLMGKEFQHRSKVKTKNKIVCQGQNQCI